MICRRRGFSTWCPRAFIPCRSPAPPRKCISMTGAAGTGLGVEKVRLAVPDFKLVTTDTGTQNLSAIFNVTLWNDLQTAGIFDMVSKSFYPLSVPGAPQEVHLNEWSSRPPNASMLAFGNLATQGGSLSVQGWLYDTKNPQSPQVLGKQYREPARLEERR